jgi:hypothetical protein
VFCRNKAKTSDPVEIHIHNHRRQDGIAFAASLDALQFVEQAEETPLQLALITEKAFLVMAIPEGHDTAGGNQAGR